MSRFDGYSIFEYFLPIGGQYLHAAEIQNNITMSKELVVSGRPSGKVVGGAKVVSGLNTPKCTRRS